MTDVDPSVFRQLLGRFATGVAVLTTVDARGAPVGMTANSVASVSLIPPLVSVCVDREAAILQSVLVAPHFALNILADHQEDVSRRFAASLSGPFAGVGYRVSEQGLALLDGAVAYIECAREATHEAGDHHIVIGRVVGGTVREGRPLIFYRGGYASLG
jgi:flavin reductase (DIM6/NTAB) family NADH-FMN oxidoreductase RutF